MFLNESLSGHYDLHNLLRRAAQICPPICLCGTVSQFLHSHNPFKIPTCGGLFPPLWEKFSAKSCLWEKFWPDTPHPRRGASVELSEGESDPSQTYVSHFCIPVSPMDVPTLHPLPFAPPPVATRLQTVDPPLTCRFAIISWGWLFEICPEGGGSMDSKMHNSRPRHFLVVWRDFWDGLGMYFDDRKDRRQTYFLMFEKSWSIFFRGMVFYKETEANP